MTRETKKQILKWIKKYEETSDNADYDTLEGSAYLLFGDILREEKNAQVS